MKYRWLNKNIEISKIEAAIKSFLEEQGFKTSSLTNGDSKRVQGVLQDTDGKKIVSIIIKGKPSDFTIDFVEDETAKYITMFSSLTALFGAGQLQLKYLKNREFYQKIEEKLWNYLEQFIKKESQG